MSASPSAGGYHPMRRHVSLHGERGQRMRVVVSLFQFYKGHLFCKNASACRTLAFVPEGGSNVLCTPAPRRPGGKIYETTARWRVPAQCWPSHHTTTWHHPPGPSGTEAKCAPLFAKGIVRHCYIDTGGWPRPAPPLPGNLPIDCRASCAPAPQPRARRVLPP